VKRLTHLSELKRAQVIQIRCLVSDIRQDGDKINVQALPMLLSVLNQDEVGPSSGNFVSFQTSEAS
jgi:hypothetical protein